MRVALYVEGVLAQCSNAQSCQASVSRVD